MAMLCEHGSNFIANAAQVATISQLEDLRELGVVHAVVAALHANPLKRSLAVAIKRVLDVLGKNNDMDQALSQLPAAINESTSIALDAGTQTALSNLASLLVLEDNVTSFYKTRGLEAVDIFASVLKTCLKDHKSNAHLASIISNCVAGISRCIYDGEQLKTYQLLKNGTIKSCVKLLIVRQGYVVECSQIVELFSNVLTREENAVYLIKKGGLTAVMSSLMSNPNSREMSLACLTFLAALAPFESSVPPLLDSGAVTTLIQMLQNPDVDLVTRALRILRTLMGHGPVTTEALLDLSLGAGLLQLLTYFASDGFLQAFYGMPPKQTEKIRLLLTELLGAVEQVSALPRGAAQLRKGGAVALICRILQYFPKDFDFQDLGRRCLRNLAETIQDTKTAVVVAKKKFEFAKVRMVATKEEKANEYLIDINENLRIWMARIAEIEELKKQGQSRREEDRLAALERENTTLHAQAELTRQKEWLEAQNELISAKLHDIDQEKRNRNDRLDDIKKQNQTERRWERRRMKMRNVGATRSKSKYKKSALLKGRKTARDIFADDD
jgi:hypothetical protein